MTLAILPAPALGDGVLAMTLAHAAHRAGRDVLVLHDAMAELQAWYPWARIEAPPAEGLGAAADADALFLGDPQRASAADGFGGPALVFGKQHWKRDAPYLVSLRATAEPVLGPLDWDGASGIVAPRARVAQPRRVALHPTSGNAAKDWPPRHWLRLAERLKEHAWLPAILAAPQDEARWQDLVGERVPVVVPGRLDAVAAWLQDGAACIGTDSGIAHLASAVGVPTLALFRKRSSARFWAPAWQPAATVAPRLRLPGGRGHRFWRALMRPRRVFEAFEGLTGSA